MGIAAASGAAWWYQNKASSLATSSSATALLLSGQFFWVRVSAESRIQISWIIVGSMSLVTLLTIFVVPTMYSIYARKTVPGAKTTVEDTQLVLVKMSEFMAK